MCCFRWFIFWSHQVRLNFHYISFYSRMIGDYFRAWFNSQVTWLGINSKSSQVVVLQCQVKYPFIKYLRDKFNHFLDFQVKCALLCIYIYSLLFYTVLLCSIQFYYIVYCSTIVEYSSYLTLFISIPIEGISHWNWKSCESCKKMLWAQSWSGVSSNNRQKFMWAKLCAKVVIDMEYFLIYFCWVNQFPPFGIKRDKNSSKLTNEDGSVSKPISLINIVDLNQTVESCKIHSEIYSYTLFEDLIYICSILFTIRWSSLKQIFCFSWHQEQRKTSATSILHKPSPRSFIASPDLS